MELLQPVTTTPTETKWRDRVLIYVDSGSTKPPRCWAGDLDMLHRTRSLGCLDDATAFIGRPLGRLRSHGTTRNSSGFHDCGTSDVLTPRFTSSQTELVGSDNSLTERYDFSCASVSNLPEADLVSPMVSTNSLATSSWDVETSNHNQPSSSSNDPRVLGVDDFDSTQPLYHKRSGRPTIPTTFGLACPVGGQLAPRQLTSIIGGLVSHAGLVSRSTSCPSVAHQSSAARRSPVPTLATTVENKAVSSKGGLTNATVASQNTANQKPVHRQNDLSPGEVPRIDIEAIEKSSKSTSTRSRRSNELTALMSSFSDRASLPATSPTSIRDPPSRSPTLLTNEDRSRSGGLHERRTQKSNAGGRSTPSPHRAPIDGDDSTVAACNGGRESRSLARTKCLQWLNSLDEDE